VGCAGKLTAGATWRPLRSGGREVELRSRGDQPDPRGVYLCPSVGEYPVYDAAIYAVISGDEQRNRLFRRAIGAAAPGATVLEIGPGPDLLWSLAAAAAGATRVYAAEVLAESARLAQETARRHPDAPIEVLTGDATGIALPQRAGVCIAEIVGCLGGAEGMAAVLADAERRHLVPAAQVIPAGVRTLVAAVSLADALAAAGAADGQPALAGMFAPYVEGIFRAAGGPFDVRMCLAGAGPDLLRSSAGVVEDLRFGAFGAARPTARGGDLRLEITRPGPVDGLLAWIELTVAPGDRVLDSLADETNWLPVCIPFAGGPVAAGAGDVLALRATVAEGEDGVHPEYFFDGELTRDDGREGVPVNAESRFSGGPFRATPLHRALLR
jgi:protein arginine N-methyltransferase 1